MYKFTKTWHSEPYPFISPKRAELSARGKNVVVTGGGSGIGKAIAEAFAEAGASSVSILGRRTDVMKSTEAAIATSYTGTKILSIAVDLVDKQQSLAAFRSISEQVGSVDVLVCNVGAYVGSGRVSDYSAETLLASLQLNVVTTLHTIQAFLPVAASEAVVLHTTSDMACTPAKEGWFGSSLYAIGKAAALKLMDYVAGENPQLHVVNVQPGWIPTEMTGYTTEAPDSASLPGSFYVWLASSEAAFLKGKVVWANWDAEELMKMGNVEGRLVWGVAGVQP